MVKNIHSAFGHIVTNGHHDCRWQYPFVSYRVSDLVEMCVALVMHTLVEQYSMSTADIVVVLFAEVGVVLCRFWRVGWTTRGWL